MGIGPRTINGGLPREAGPAQRVSKRNAWRAGLVKVTGCMCEACRAINPARQAAWERHVRDVKRHIGKKEI